MPYTSSDLREEIAKVLAHKSDLSCLLEDLRDESKICAQAGYEEYADIMAAAGDAVERLMLMDFWH